MLYEVLLFLTHVSMMSSSIVLDSTGQRSVYVTDYCPKMKFCAEGAHVMCMYYNSAADGLAGCESITYGVLTSAKCGHVPNMYLDIPLITGQDPSFESKDLEYIKRSERMSTAPWGYSRNHKSLMGPRCSNAQNISITQEIANKLLDVTNAVRSRIAQGKEKGKHGDNLPRGYGIFRLNWDTELATFAQVLANQCVLRHDLCRATKRFPDPGQTAGLVRFTYPDWFPVSKAGNFTSKGLDPSKLLYATTQILKSWYGQKNSVTPDMITIYPDWTSNPNSQEGRLYMEMIYGSATHMGCGISAYTQYAFHDNNAPLNYNSIQIICNYSARPRKGAAVYNTVPPGDTDLPFSRCGCPVGSEGDKQCLCQEVPKAFHAPTSLKQEIQQCPDGQVCDPTVVVLPIFTIEDAPPEKLLHHDSFSNASLRNSIHNNIFQSGYDPFQNKRDIYESDKANNLRVYESKDKFSQKQSRTQNVRPASHHQNVAIRNRYFDKKHVEKQESQSHGPRNARKKTSVFSRAAKFELPISLGIRPTKQSGIKDVVPRKDFTIAKQLVNKYLYGKNDLLKSEYNKPVIEEARDDKHEVSSHLNVHLPMTHETIKHPMSNQENNLVHPLLKDIHDVKNTFNEHQQPNEETKNVAPSPEQHEMKNIFENQHNLHEVFNILNATKPKLSYDINNYHNIQRPVTETILNRAEQNVIQDAFLKQIVSNTNDYKNFNSVTEETDNKLMDLLDTLEQEVKHIELRDKDKQLFDAKIRKIYGKVVGKPASLLDLSVNEYAKPREQMPDVKKPYIMQKSVQQEPKEEPLDEKFATKVALDKSDQRLEINLKKYDNLTRGRNDIDRYDEKVVYTKRGGFREMRHRDTSNEQRYRDYERNQGYSERKRYRNNDFDRNTLTDLDETRHRGSDIKYRSRNTERDRRYRGDEPDYRNDNEQQHKNMNEHYHRNSDLDKSIRKKNYYMSNDEANNDPLSIERRRFYQEKIDNIERKLQMRNYKKRKDKTRHMRPVRPAGRKSESQMDIYGRGHFAHGY